MADEKPESTPETPAEGAPAEKASDATVADSAAAEKPGEEAEEAPPPPPPHPVTVALQQQFPTQVEVDGEDTVGAPIFRVGADDLIDVMGWLRDDEAMKFDFLSSLTVTDWTERAPRFDVVYNLYSLPHNRFITVKTGCADGDGVPTVCDIWGTANWHEREAYDLYGVEFLGHPELERIFLPEDWEGFPLRKDYPLEGPNLELLTRQQAAFRGGRFDRIRGDYEMNEQERQMSSAGIVGALWTPKPPAPPAPPAAENPDGGDGGEAAGAESSGD